MTTPDREIGLRLSRQVYRLRTFGLALGFFSVGSVFYAHGASPLAWAGLIAHGFVWPHMAWLRARRATDPHAAERANLLTDSTVCGVWIALMDFCLLPTVLVFAMQGMDKIGWGRRFLVRSLAQQA